MSKSKMTVLLTKSVPFLGNSGDIVVVSPGFYRNFLSRKNLALFMHQSLYDMQEELKAKFALEELQKLGAFSLLLNNFSDTSITFNVKVDAYGHLYGSVSAGDIAARLSGTDFIVKEDMVKLEKPIKMVGEKDVAIVYKGQQFSLKVIVASETK